MFQSLVRLERKSVFTDRYSQLLFEELDGRFGELVLDQWVCLAMSPENGCSLHGVSRHLQERRQYGTAQLDALRRTDLNLAFNGSQPLRTTSPPRVLSPVRPFQTHQEQLSKE